jgi:hypothetical protein
MHLLRLLFFLFSKCAFDTLLCSCLQILQILPQLLDQLRCMLGRSPKLCVALSMGGLMPCLLEMMNTTTPLLRIRVLDIVRALYQNYPRPKVGHSCWGATVLVLRHKYPTVPGWWGGGLYCSDTEPQVPWYAAVPGCFTSTALMY